jgi:hypothetical protein
MDYREPLSKLLADVEDACRVMRDVARRLDAMARDTGDPVTRAMLERLRDQSEERSKRLAAHLESYARSPSALNDQIGLRNGIGRRGSGSFVDTTGHSETGLVAM